MKNNTYGLNKTVEAVHVKSETKNADSMHIMLVGNPNCGKSTLFNRLCNVRVRTGNYPGVTVSRHVGNYAQGIQIIDIPGIYSLSSATEEEKIAVAELLDNDAELIINVIDSSIVNPIGVFKANNINSDCNPNPTNIVLFLIKLLAEKSSFANFSLHKSQTSWAVFSDKTPSYPK